MVLPAPADQLARPHGEGDIVGGLEAGEGLLQAAHRENVGARCRQVRPEERGQLVLAESRRRGVASEARQQRDDAAGHQPYHQQQNDGEDREPRGIDEAQRFGQHGEGEAAEQWAEQARFAAHDGGEQAGGGIADAQEIGCDDEDLRHQQRAGKGCNAARDRDVRDPGAHRRDAERFGEVGRLAHGDPGAAERASLQVAQPHEQQGDDENEQEKVALLLAPAERRLPGQRRRGDQHAHRPAREVDPVGGNQAQDLGGGERRDGEIGAAQPRRGEAHQNTERCSRQWRQECHQPEVQAELGADQGGGIGAEPEEGGMAEGDVTHLAKRHAETQGEHPEHQGIGQQAGDVGRVDQERCQESGRDTGRQPDACRPGRYAGHRAFFPARP
mgnify:CR=1 FL=1